MRKRRNLIIALLLVVAMVAGIGYAALARDLTITGSADIAVSQDDFPIEFTAAVSSNEDFATAAYDSTTAASYELKGMTAKGQKVELTYTVKNNAATGSDVNAKLAKITDNPGTFTITDALGTNTSTVEAYFTKTITIEKGAISYEYEAEADETYDNVGETIVLAPQESLTVKITFTLKKTVGMAGDSAINLTGASVVLNFTTP